jgi:hypothetical protein
MKYNITPPKGTGFFRSTGNTKTVGQKDNLTGREVKLGKIQGMLMRRKPVAASSRGMSSTPSKTPAPIGTEVVAMDVYDDSMYLIPCYAGTPPVEYFLDAGGLNLSAFLSCC